ncbi:hypothetical protein DYB32_006480 [Aphanomyces invadans]|uniref:Uncharacterized protein n=1 Tax=Aphanomyces invadans TaxID=157072 RepID=A0A418ARF4_9STRA|nr:hypothetical protein DYB32_006480 [Aphanomyces invadans]
MTSGDLLQGPNESRGADTVPRSSLFPPPTDASPTAAPPVDANVEDRPSTGDAWPPLDSDRPRATVSEPSCPLGSAAPLRSVPLTPSLQPSPSRVTTFEPDNSVLPSANPDLDFQPIRGRNLGNVEFNQPITAFGADSSQPISALNVGDGPGISPSTHTVEATSTPLQPAARNSGNQQPLDYSQVLRGFTAATRQSARAAFVTPPAAAIDAILLELAKPKRDRADVLNQIDLARPYTPKLATARFTVDTGDALTNLSNETIMSSLFASTQTNTVKALLPEFVQVTRLGRGGLMISVTSASVRKTLGGQYLSILGKKYPIPMQEEHPLDPLCYMDITGIRDTFDSTQFYRKLTQMGVDVVYQSHRAVIPGTSCHTNAWRVYFVGGSIPDELKILGEPINQIKFQKFHYRVYFKGTKGTPFKGTNGVSSHCLDLEVKRPRTDAAMDDPHLTSRPLSSPTDPVSEPVVTNDPKRPKSQTNVQRNLTKALNPVQTDTATPRAFASSLQTSITEDLPANPFCVNGPGEHIEVYEDDGEPDIDDTISVADAQLEMEVDAPFQEVVRRGKRKERARTAPMKLVDFASPNFFAVLRNTNVGFRPLQWSESHDIITYIPTFERQTLSEDTRDECVTTLHQVGGVVSFDVESMSVDRLHDVIEASLYQLHQEELADAKRTFREAAADSLGDLGALVRHGQVDKIWTQTQKKPLSANVILHELAQHDPSTFASLIQLHTWQRWMAASTAYKVQPFRDTFKQLFGSSRLSAAHLQTRRGELRERTNENNHVSISAEQLELEDALSLFEVWFCIMAPTFFQKDAWVLSGSNDTGTSELSSAYCLVAPKPSHP